VAIAKNPSTFSTVFRLDRERLSALGVLDGTLALDSKLFIDPLLLEQSSHEEMARDGVKLYRSFYEKIIAFLKVSDEEYDFAWQSAYKMILTREIAGTGLGHGAGSIHGSGIGPSLARRIMRVAHQIVGIGVQDPDLFAAMALFEEKIGPDRISDLTTKILLPALGEFNRRILTELGMTGVRFVIERNEYTFLKNPFEPKHVPIILIPSDILSPLPIASDWDGICDAAAHNDILRHRVNSHIASIWEIKSKRDKELLKTQLMASSDAFKTLLDLIHSADKKAYDPVSDPLGRVTWAPIGQAIAAQYPVTFPLRDCRTLDDAFQIVKTILDQYKHLIEQCGLNKELYSGRNMPRHESTAQRLFFAVAYSYCKANDLDLNPEIDTGNGKIDFKLSKGDKIRVLVELKLSSNKMAVQGYETQLEAYKKAQETLKAFYVVLDVGKMGSKVKRLTDMRNDALKSGDPLSELIFIDGIPKTPPSKR
jgi:hypothetical protein